MLQEHPLRTLLGSLLVLMPAAAVSNSRGEPSGDEPTEEQWRAREAELLSQIDQLKQELAELSLKYTSREREWLNWLRALEHHGVAELPEPPSFLAERLVPTQNTPESLLVEAAQERALAALSDLRALLLAEEVHELDFLEIGCVQSDAQGGYLGPVVVRLLDERGHLAGTLAADRLRLECSRTGWGVTLVFENGLEKRGGEVEPFGPPLAPGSERGGLRRIHLAGADPAPWITALPELLGSSSPDNREDDGLWDLLRVRQEVNRLLALDKQTGSWRLVGLSGVLGSVLQGVHVVELDDAGQVRRRLFADHMRISQRAGHIQLELENGVQERADRRAPFLDNRYRIYLTGAQAADWIQARLPGLAAPDRSLQLELQGPESLGD